MAESLVEPDASRLGIIAHLIAMLEGEPCLIIVVAAFIFVFYSNRQNAKHVEKVLDTAVRHKIVDAPVKRKK